MILAWTYPVECDPAVRAWWASVAPRDTTNHLVALGEPETGELDGMPAYLHVWDRFSAATIAAMITGLYPAGEGMLGVDELGCVWSETNIPPGFVTESTLTQGEP